VTSAAGSNRFIYYSSRNALAAALSIAASCISVPRTHVDVRSVIAPGDRLERPGSGWGVRDHVQSRPRSFSVPSAAAAANSIANPPSKWRTTQPCDRPSLIGVPMAGEKSDRNAAPHTDRSRMRQG
jgi:hypothetical protein